MTLHLNDKNASYITTQCQTPMFCTPLSSKTPTRLQPVGSLKVGRYISEFQHSLQGIYTRIARIIYPVDYVKPTLINKETKSTSVCSRAETRALICV